MKEICSFIIQQGIDYNGEHYALTDEDQINLLKLTQMAEATPDSVPLFYHADGKLCRQYSHDEIRTIGLIGTTWITYHTTYFNFLKNQLLNEMNDIDEIINFKYGDPLHSEYQQQIDIIIGDQHLFDIPIVEDDFDYSFLFKKLDYGHFKQQFIGIPDDIEENGDDSNGGNETSETEETIETTETNQEPTIEETEEGINDEEDIDIPD